MKKAMLNAFAQCSRVAIAALLFAAAGCELGIEGKFGDGHDYGDNDPNLVVAMGDSITEGYGVGSGACYVPRLAAMLGKSIANEGRGGAESSDGAGRVNSVLNTYKPGVLIIFYGANDLIGGAGAGFTIGNLRAMIRAAKANKTIPVIATLTPAFGSHSFIAGAVRDRSQRIRQLAQEEGAALADLNSAFGNSSAYILEDGLHPNALGHQLIAMTFYDVMH